jgi:hypothetical protein
VENRTEKKLTNIQLVFEERVAPLGELQAREARNFTIKRDSGVSLQSFVTTHGAGFQNVVTSRKGAFGASERGQISDLANASMAASFLSHLYRQAYEGNFISPPGLDLSPVIDHGGAVILAWAQDYAPIKPMYQFTPRRSQHHTLWRVTVDLKGQKPAADEQPEA